MRRKIVLLFAQQVIKAAWANKADVLLSVLVGGLLIYAAITGLYTYRQQTESRIRFQKEVREHWEEMPDKHPHRMAHYGYIAFRAKHPISIFDFGTESYTGNAIFLEAHKQNSINFSEAGFSTGLLRFGEISMATVLQVLVSLVIFFIGFATVATDRENGTLKLLLSQGASWKEIIFGKAIGLTAVAMCFVLPAFLLLGIGLAFSGGGISGDALMRFLLLLLTYSLYVAILSLVAVVISTLVKKAKVALVGLTGIWLLFAVILPRTTQAMGTYLFPSPSRIAFETAVEKDILQLGDSHNPEDPYFRALKDSVLKANNAGSVEQLSFNYSGFQMQEGERLSSEIYNRHQARLLTIYHQQNNVSRLSAFINPFAAVRNISMALSGTDFLTYKRFGEQTETYRYSLAQHMNELQIKLVSNKKLAPTDQPYSISREYWKAFPDFQYQGLSSSQAVRGEALSVVALSFWVLLLLVVVSLLSKKLKVV